MNNKQAEPVILKPQKTRSPPWLYALAGALAGFAFELVMCVPLDTIITYMWECFYYGRACRVENIFEILKNRRWFPGDLIVGILYGISLGLLYWRVKVHRGRIDALHHEFELWVAALRHHYKNLAIGIHGFSGRIKRKVAALPECEDLVLDVAVLDEAAQRLTHTLGEELLFLKALTSDTLTPTPNDLYPVLVHAVRDLKSLRDPEGLCILHSLKPEKDKSIFEQSLKEKLAQEDCDFREVFFPGPISFAKRKFTKPANFHGARFSGWADFREAEFSEGAYFSHARFSQAALFTKAKFLGQAEFIEVEMAGEVDFGGAGFEGHGVFRQINEPRDGAAAPPFAASFQFLHLGPQSRLSFQDLSLAQVSFLGTDLRQVSFHNVKWHWLYGRQAVYDEVLLTKRPGPHLISLTSTEGALDYEKLCAKVEELYRYLKLNYEHEGDHKQAGDFHFGEKEMHRRANPWRRWFPLSWYNLYRVLSGYGERPLRALSWLVGVVAGLARRCNGWD